MSEVEMMEESGSNGNGSVQGELFEKPLGERLRAERLEQNLELEDIAHHLKVEASVLLAIEEGSGPPHGLPDVFYKGFTRNYARHLGVKIKPDEVRTSATTLDGSLMGKKGISTPSINLDLERLKPVVTQAGVLTTRLVGWARENPLYAVVPLLLLGLVVWGLSGDESPSDQGVSVEAVVSEKGVERVVNPSQEESSAEEESDDAPAVTTSPESESVAVVAQSPEIDPMSVPRGTVTIQYIDGAWTQIRDGLGRVPVKGMVNAGVIKDVEAPLPLEISLGKSRVRVKFNGEEFDFLNYINDDGTVHFVLGE